MDYYPSKHLSINKSNTCCGVTGINIEFRGTLSTIQNLCSDIWEHIFEYFNTMDLFMTFSYITAAIDEVLFNENNRFYLRDLILDAGLKYLPSQILLNRIISLTLHDTCCLKVIELCTEVRSIKLIGAAKWITSMIRQISYTNKKVEHLAVIMIRIETLSELIVSILPIFSLRKLEICTDDLEDIGTICILSTISSKIEQLLLRSCSIAHWNDLLSMLSKITNIRLLNISMIERNPKPMPSFIFQNLRILSLGLLEVSFNWIIELVRTTPCLTKLKLNGLVDGEGFVVNQRWMHLFDSAPTLVRIFVNVSLEQGEESYHCEKIQTTLHAFNLNLICNDDEVDCNSYYGNVHRWWNLEGVITKQ